MMPESRATQQHGEAHYRRLLAALPVAAYTCDADGLITYFNHQAAQVWGREPEIGSPLDRYCGSHKLLSVDGTAIRHEESWMAVALQTGRECHGREIVVERADGSRVSVLAHASPLHDDQDKIVGAVSVLVDISRRRLAEAALGESQQRFQALSTNSPAAIFIKDLDGRYVVANPLACEVLGRPEGAVGCTDHDLLPAEVADVLRQHDLQVIATGRTVESEEIVSHGGDERWFLSVKFPLTGADGQATGVGGVAIDVTDRRRTAQALAESEERFHTLADNMAQLAWMADAAGAIFWLNKRWFDYTGLTLEESQGWGWQQAHHPEHVQRVVEKFRDCVGSGSPWEDTFQLRGQDGRYRWFLSRAIPIRDSRGQVQRWFGTNTDVTAQREAEESLREADRRKDDFLAVLAHELRNPLAPICNSLHILGLADDVDPAIAKIRDIMERQTNHLVRLVDDLLEVSRITQGKIELRSETVELAAVIRSAIETSRPMIDAARHQLAIVLPAEPLTLQADPVRLAQVVANLLNNAAKYTPERGQVWLSASADASEAVIEVRDNGIGIPADVLPHVFEKFTQWNGAQGRPQGGLGIGLALARSLVEMHGGRIEAHSDGLGRGTRVTVRLPLAASAAPAKAPRAENRPVERAVPTRRFLVVDDARDSAYILGKLLESMGQVVSTANNGVTALEIARAERPDVVISDIAMAEMDGYQLAARLRAEPTLAHTVLVALTGYGQESDRQRTKEAGFEHHLVKPVGVETLEQLFAALAAPQPAR